MDRGTVIHIAAISRDLRSDNDAADRIALARLMADLRTMMLRHGRGKILGIVVDAIRDSEREGSKW